MMKIAANYALNTAHLAQEAQSAEQRTVQQLKPLPEQVYISKRAQQLFDIYTQSANQAKDFYNANSTSSAAQGNVAAEQMLSAVQMMQKRQIAALIAAYAQQPAGDMDQVPTDTPTPYASAQDISINTVA